MTKYMKCFNIRLLIVVTVTCYWNLSSAQTTYDQSYFENKYPSNPYVGVSYKAELGVIFDKSGIPCFLIKERETNIILKNNCNELTEFRNYYSANDVIKKSEIYSLIPENGKYKRIDAENIKKQKSQSNYFDDIYFMTGHYPSVNKGTILINNNDYISNDPDWGYRFYFGNSAPCEEFSVSVSVPENVKLIWRFAGNDTSNISFTEQKAGKLTRYVWSCKNQKGYKSEVLEPDMKFFVPHILLNIAGYKTKDGFVSRMGDVNDFYKWEKSKVENINQSISPEVKKLSDSIIAHCNNSTDKVKAIFHWVQNNIKYISIEDGENGFVPQQADEVIRQRFGDCKGKSSAIQALLKAAGEKTSLATVGTRDLPYTFSKYPLISTANHLIAIWWNENGVPVPLDGTTRFTGIYTPPANIQGKECFIIKDDKDYLIYSIPQSIPSDNFEADSIFFHLENKQLKGHATVLLKGETRAGLMYQLDGSDSTDIIKTLTSYFDIANKKLAMSNVRLHNAGNDYGNLRITFDVSLPDYLTTTGDNVYINMNLIKKFNDIEIKTDRTRPVESGGIFSRKIVIRFTIPENYSIASLPEKSAFTHPKFGYEISYQPNGNFIDYNFTLDINFLLLENAEIQDFGRMIQSLKNSFRKTVSLKRKL